MTNDFFNLIRQGKVPLRLETNRITFVILLGDRKLDMMLMRETDYDDIQFGYEISKPANAE